MRQIIFNILLLLCSTTFILHADIDAQIDAIKNASVEERFKLMNAFKKNLIKMKKEERIKAIIKLSKKSNNTHAKKALDELNQNSKREHIQNQIEHNHIDEDNIVNETNDEGGEENDN